MSYAPANYPSQPPASYGPSPYGSVPPQSGFHQAQAAGSVNGVPLEPGERVVYFQKHDYTVGKVVMIVFGLLTLIALVGIIFIIWGFFYGNSKPMAHAITNRRAIVWMRGQQPKSLPIPWIVDMVPEREKHKGSGGLLSAAVAGIQNMTMESQAANAQKIAPAYWTRTNAIRVTYSNGMVERLPADVAYGSQMGLLLARAVFNREADYLPPVAHPA